MSKRIDVRKEKDMILLDKLIKENFKRIVGVDIQDAVIDTKKMKKDYFEYVQRMANFLHNHSKLDKVDSIQIMKDVEKTYNITVEV